jgi:hypothetical protein
MPEKVYLGDGVYARSTGYEIMLETDRDFKGVQIRHFIVLGTNELNALEDYRAAERVKADAKGEPSV